MTETKTDRNRSLARAAVSVISSFGFRVCFGFRASDFGFPAQRASPPRSLKRRSLRLRRGGGHQNLELLQRLVRLAVAAVQVGELDADRPLNGFVLRLAEHLVEERDRLV